MTNELPPVDPVEPECLPCLHGMHETCRSVKVDQWCECACDWLFPDRERHPFWSFHR